MFSAEVVLGCHVITYSCAANSKEEFIKIVKQKVAAKYPKYTEGMMIRKVVKL
jgi:hypothetical protein